VRFLTRLQCAFLFLAGSSLQAQAEAASFPLSPPDSGSLPADLYGRGTDGVILIGHGGYSTRATWAPLARLLADSGFRVLVFETRAAITLQAGQETACLYDAPCMARDVLAAIRYLRSRGATRLVLMGGSAGGGAAAEAATDPAAAVDALVLLAPMAISNPERVTGRKLLAVGREDRSGEGLRLPGIKAQYARFPGPKQLLVLEASAHGQRLLDGSTGPSLRAALLQFLRR
jgi:pimeloyl-ACP methyl ester carboxylesterase